MKNRIISMLLCVVMCLSMTLSLTGCSTGESDNDAFVIMTESLDGLFNPFFSCMGTFTVKYAYTNCRDSHRKRNVAVS